MRTTEKNNMSEAGRARIAAAQKARWAKKKAAAAATPLAQTQDVPITADESDAAAKMEADIIKNRAAENGIAKMVKEARGSNGHGFIPPPEEPVHKLHQCMRCGWQFSDATFTEAIAAHTAFHAERGTACKPSLSQPSDKRLKQQLLARLTNNPRAVSL